MSKISMSKKYKTRSGLPVRILCLDMKDPDYPVVGLIRRPTGFDVVASFTPEGKFMIHYDGDTHDLIEVSPYEDFKINEPVMVRHSGRDDWNRRHFAGVGADGGALCWDSGCTSFTSKDSFGWEECRRPTPKELAGK